jgi:hypothetical protein
MDFGLFLNLANLTGEEANRFEAVLGSDVTTAPALPRKSCVSAVAPEESSTVYR